MRYSILNDPFEFKQPKMTFSADLALPLHISAPKDFGKLPPKNDELGLDKIDLRIEFTDPLLDTAYDDFFKFAKAYGIEICKEGVPFTVRCGESECFEAYSICVLEDEVVISAADTEGIRRALFFAEDEMKRREGARLPKGEIKRKPFIKERISRCYFSPASHAAIEATENELLDDVDYYPDEYLNRLAHDGVNALWLGASVRHLVKSDIISEYGSDADVRMKKLNGVIEKCKRYGIGTYLFSVDPPSNYKNDFLNSYPELMGDEENASIKHLCPSVDRSVEYIKEAYGRLFRKAPGLKGYINLSVGESQSHCASASALYCKRCKKKFGSLGKTLAFVEKTICDAIHEVAPDAEYVSWTYAQRAWREEDIKEASEHRHTEVKHLVNFEDLGIEKQLGKDRIAYDYWISYVGPGGLFRRSLEYDKKRGVKTYAKIQVCSSHEISTVPYIIAPGLLYEKYKYMHENSVEGVMQCWFFGNYPCLMNKAAGELSFEPFPSKEEFLRNIAGIYWGRDADTAAQAYECFARGYRNFPIGVDFEWYSPMQDSPCAPYHLEPIDLPMPGTWRLDNMVGSDRVCDSILDSHTLDEVITLCAEMSNKWNEGSAILAGLDTSAHPDGKEQITVAESTGLIFQSGLNTLKFYDMRNKLALGHEDPWELIAKMKATVEEEIGISERLIPITEADNRIGYHSEAHGYKIFPEKLKWRIEEMKKLLVTEFPTVEERIGNGECPLPFYYGEEEGAVRYEIKANCPEDAEWLCFKDEEGRSDGGAMIRVCCGEDGYTLELELVTGVDYVRIDPEFKMFHRTSPIFLQDGKLEIKESYQYSLFGERLAERRAAFACSHRANDASERYTVSFRAEALEMKKGDPFRLMISVYRGGRRSQVLARDDRIFERLVLGTFSPDAFAFFVPK